MKNIRLGLAPCCLAIGLVLAISMIGVQPASGQGMKGIGAVPTQLSNPTAAITDLGGSWWYDWDGTPDFSNPSASLLDQFVPMVWGHWGAIWNGKSLITTSGNNPNTESLDEGVMDSYLYWIGYGNNGQNYPQAFLGFNEPDWVGQSDITPRIAVQAYKGSVIPFSQDNANWYSYVNSTYGNSSGYDLNFSARGFTLSIGSPASGTGSDEEYPSNSGLPGYDSSGDMDPSYAAAYANYLNGDGYTPPSSRTAGYSYSWLYSFMLVAQNTTLDSSYGSGSVWDNLNFITVHPYVTPDVASDYQLGVNLLQNELAIDYDLFQKPLWVTEYAMDDPNPNASNNWDPWCGTTNEANFAWGSVQMMDALPYVDRYAWYAALGDGEDIDTWNNASGVLTNVGNGYLWANQQANGGTGNYVTDPGFESSAMSQFLPWQSSGPVSVANTIQTGGNPITIGWAHSGIYAASMGGSSASVLYQNVAGVPSSPSGTSHTLTAWVSSYQASSSYMYVQNAGGNTGNWVTTPIPNTGGAWQQITINFTASASSFYIGFNGETGTWIGVDDVVLY